MQKFERNTVKQIRKKKEREDLRVNEEAKTTIQAEKQQKQYEKQKQNDDHTVAYNGKIGTLCVCLRRTSVCVGVSE